MTLISPAFLWGAIAVALGIVALHFIVTRQPRASVLPTARFVPDSTATATVRHTRPSDLLLMLLRVLVVLATGIALAKPVVKPTRRADARLILMDASRSVGNIRESVDSARTLFRGGDAIVVFDSAARSLGEKGRDSLGSIRRAGAPGNLSAGLVAALREGSSLHDKADSLELVIVSPFLAEEHNAATDSIRKLWPGRARLVRIASRADSSVGIRKSAIDLRSSPADPVAVAVSLAEKSLGSRNARIVRSASLTAEDSVWMMSGDNVVALWPVVDRPRFAVERAPADQSGGLAGKDLRLVASFGRRWIFPSDSLRAFEVIVRWVDGDPAVVEKKMGAGCLRSVAVPVTVSGDLVIRPEFVQLVDAITAPCNDIGSPVPLPQAIAASIAGQGGLAPNDAFAPREDVSSPLAPWLFGIALASAILELLVRRRSPNGRGASEETGRRDAIQMAPARE